MKPAFKKLAIALAGAGALASASVAQAAGVTFLIGSDVMSFHGDSNFINPVVDQMANFGSKKLLFVGDVGSTNYTNGNVAITFTGYAGLAALSGTDLSAYSGIYIDSPGTCCSDPGSSVSGAGVSAATLSAFVAAGGSLGVGNFWGDDFWDTILGFDAGPGVTSGVGGITCEDPGVSTAGGLAFGFAASYTEGCFVHQTYDPTFWAGKGYFALQTNGNAGATFGDWVTMATGFTDPGGELPEPSTMALLGISLLGLAGLRRKSA